MSGFTDVTGIPARLPLENVDTDQLIPARFMSRPRSEGYGPFLLHDMRETEPAARLPEGAEILIAGRNFGCGSSREAAVYALVDFGIRAVLAPSFGDIFASNAVNNGLLPARMSQDALDRLDGPLRVDLAGAVVHHAGGAEPFEIDPVWQTKLLNGWDDIDLTIQHRDDIAAFKTRHHAAHPWART
jgi:3-isopropylmalate/(R)-2-methylmalate dehydratase small subunit